MAPALIAGAGSGQLTTNIPGNWPTPLLEWSPTTNPADPPVWVDITSKLRRWSISRGRRNWLSTMNPGSASFDLDNTAGDFTPADSAATYYPNIIPGKRVRFSLLFGGVTYRRYTGFTTGYPMTWKNTDSQVTFTCIDGLGLMALATLKGAYAGTVLADSPTFLYEFRESGGTTMADTSPNANTGAYSPTGITWGQPDPITDGSDHAVQFDGRNGYATSPPVSYGATGWSIEVWAKASGVPGSPAIIIGSDNLSGSIAPYWYLAYDNISAAIYFQVGRTSGSAGSFVSSTGGSDYADGAWHHFVVTWAAATNLESLYIDSSLVASSSGLAYQSFPTRPVTIGPADEGLGAGAVPVSVYGAAFYANTALTYTQIAAHYQAASAWLNDRSDTRVGRILDAISWLASDRNISAGVSTLAAADDYAGKAPSAALNEVATTENGLVFVDQSGRLTFLGRNTLQLAPYSTSQGTFGDSAAEIAYPMGDGKLTLDEQDLWTQIQVQRKGGALFTARASAATIGKFYTVRQPGTVNSLTVSDFEAQQLANWLLGQSEVPLPRIDTLNMLGTAGNSASLLARELGDLVTYKGRPVGVGSVSPAVRILGMKESADLKERIYKCSWLLFARESQAMIWDSLTYGAWDTYVWGI